MNSLDLVSMGIRNLWRRKLRTFLTVLGVIIGTSSIIVMLSLGFGMREAFNNQIKQMGSVNIITVSQGYNEMYYDGGVSVSSSSSSTEKKLNEESLAEFKNIPDVTAVTPIVEDQIKLVDGKYSTYMSLKGIEPSSMKEFDFKIGEGRLFQTGDQDVLIFGGGMKHTFYDENSRRRRGPDKEPEIDLMNDKIIMTFDMNYGRKRNPNESSLENQDGEKKVNYKTYKVKTVGILQEGSYDTDYNVYMPIEQVKKLIKEKNKAEGNKTKTDGNEYQTILVKVEDISKVQEVQQKIKDMGYEAWSLSDALESLNKTSVIIQAVLGGIGAVSLLVAAIGIANTMIMSIYERTKEIGVMKVIGASLRDIKKLFLFEAGMIGLLGGTVGIVLSEVLSIIINKVGINFLQNNMGASADTRISIIPIWLIFAAMGFSALVGLMSGYYPAKKAMKLSALEAIRTE
jgi:ABC-type antimicrobial peptide transport system permease subunit